MVNPSVLRSEPKAQFEEQPSSGKILGRFSLLRSLFSYGLGPGLGLLSAPLLARALGVEGRGQFAALLQPLTFLDAIIAGGLPVAAAYLANREGTDLRLLKLLFKAAIPWATAGAILAALYSIEIQKGTGVNHWAVTALWLTAVAGLFLSIVRGACSNARSMYLIDRERALGVIFRLLVLAAMVWFGSSSAYSFAVAQVVAAWVASLILFRHIRSWPSGTGNLPKLASLQKYSLSAWLGTLSAAGNARLDQALMPLAAAPALLGHYAVAVTVAEVPSILGTIGARNLLSRYATRTDKVARIIGLYTVVGIFLCLFTAAAVWLLLPVVFGEEFSNSVPAALILLIGTGLGIPASCITGCLQGAGAPGLASICFGAGALVTMALIPLGLRQDSLYPFCFISVISQFVVLLLSTVLLFRHHRRTNSPVTAEDEALA